MIFDSEKYALAYGRLFMYMQAGEYGDIENIVIRYAFATAIKTALGAKIMTKEGLLYSADDAIVQKSKAQE